MPLKQDDIINIIEKAKDQKKPFETIAEIARKKYAGEPDQVNGYTGEPVCNWNFVRSSIQNTVSRLILGEPRPNTRAKRTSQLADAAQWFNDRVDSQLSRSSIAPILRAGEQDASLSGNGFFTVDIETGDIEFGNYFDVYVDNIMGKVTDPWGTARYFCMRYIAPPGEFWRKYESYLKGKFKKKDIEATGINLPGREIVGLDYSEVYEESEKRAGVKLLTNFIEGNEVQSTDDLVEYWKVWTWCDEAESGWREYIVYDNKIIHDEEIPAFLPGPPVFCFAADSDMSQFYQPSDFIHAEKVQRPVNFITNKVNSHINLIEFPPLVRPKTGISRMSYRTGMAVEGEFTWRGVRGEEITVDDMSQMPQLMQLPSFPNQYLSFREQLKLDARDIEMPAILEGQTPNQDVMSGRALRELRAEATTRLALRETNRDETLRDLGKYLCLLSFSKARQDAIGEAYSIYEQAAIQAMIMLREEGVLEGEDIDGIPFETIVPFLPPELQGYASIEEMSEVFMPEQLQGVTFENIRSDFDFNWIISRPMDRDTRVDQIAIALNSTMPLAMNDPVLALKLAAVATGDDEVAGEMIDVIQSYQVEMAQQASQEQESAINEEEELRTQDAIAQGEAEAEQILDEETIKELAQLSGNNVTRSQAASESRKRRQGEQ